MPRHGIAASRCRARRARLPQTPSHIHVSRLSDSASSAASARDKGRLFGARPPRRRARPVVHKRRRVLGGRLAGRVVWRVGRVRTQARGKVDRPAPAVIDLQERRPPLARVRWVASAALRRRRTAPVQRLLARLAIRPPEADDRVGGDARHVGVKVCADVDELMEHHVRGGMKPHDEVAHVARIHSRHHLLPRFVVQLLVLLDQLGPGANHASVVRASPQASPPKPIEDRKGGSAGGGAEEE
mmetsp:Transcript_37176/g.123192  ORF Transcript_37176/g.123192 Transcript_37176/m.123192 type:complete len:242 (+) Transcript_37176:178-903(+)